MELRVLRYVIAVADERHFGRAAHREHVAQSALSQQVRRLETQLGVRLFDRSTRHVAVTAAGRTFLDHARSVVSGADRAEAEMRAVAAGRAGIVSVGFVGTATYDVLPRLAHELRRQLPDVELVLRGEQLNPPLVAGVADGAFDLALVRPVPLPRGLEARRLRIEQLVVALPSNHELAGRSVIDLADLADERFVVHPGGQTSSINSHVLAACERAGFTPSDTIEVAETSTLAVSVAAGLGVAVVPAPVRSLQLTGVVYRDLRDAPDIELMLLSRTTQVSPAVARVAEVTRSVVNDEGP